MVSDRFEYFALLGPWFRAEFVGDEVHGVCEPFCSDVLVVSVFVSVYDGGCHVLWCVCR